jgi:hypothetical protein
MGRQEVGDFRRTADKEAGTVHIVNTVTNTTAFSRDGHQHKRVHAIEVEEERMQCKVRTRRNLTRTGGRITMEKG